MPYKLNPDRYFSPNSAQRELARSLYELVENAPIISPHGHVDPKLFSDPNATFGTPTDLLIIPDHYVFRMLYSQGIPLESLGVPRIDGGEVESDHRKIWQVFAEHYFLFRGTPSGGWIDHSLHEILNIGQRLNGKSAQDIYDEISEKLSGEAFQPRNLLSGLNIEVLCTTDAATDALADHQKMRADGFGENIYPTFRPDAVVNLETEGWIENIQKLSEVSGIVITNYASFVQALEQRRTFFKEMGAHATDHAALTAYTQELSPKEANSIFQAALQGEVTAADAMRFTGHMLIEMARMSIDDGLVMQVHVGSFRNHNQRLFQRFGRDKGADIPIASEFTQNLRPLLNKYGSDPNLHMILFTLDEDTYSRELATLAGVYPSLKVGPPWWFHDSPNGMRRYLNTILETAGIYNTAGFNDDTRAFLSIPARHDVWRRVTCDWLAGMVLEGRIAEEDAPQIAADFAYNLAQKAYHFA
ncbi:MAG: glucuronate isomerase [Anaerolineae bacterium]|jgi:glucuronate isomerase|nr:glucuronate isomerase [Anaerolineae bacterium]